MFVSIDELITYAVAAGAREPARHIRPGRPGWDAWAEPALALVVNQFDLTSEQTATLIAQCAAADGNPPPGCSLHDALFEAVQPDTLAALGACTLFVLGVPAGLAGLAWMVG